MTRTIEEAQAAWEDMISLRRAGYHLMPLTDRRTPFTGWRTEDYSGFEFIAHLMRGGAVGVRLGPQDLVIDIDPRNGGDASFDSLCMDVGVALDGPDVPAVRSGGGGRHLYYRKPEGRTRVNLPDTYPGIDFKREGGYVVAPGSHHPSGGRYTWLRPLVVAPPAPQTLLSLLADAGGAPRVVTSLHEEMAAAVRIGDPEHVASLDDLRVPDRIRALIVDSGEPGQRSERLRSVILSMMGSGASDETILGLITDPRWAISESVIEKDDHDGYARRQIVRARAWRLAQMDFDFDTEVQRQQAAPINDISERRRLAPIRGNRN